MACTKTAIDWDAATADQLTAIWAHLTRGAADKKSPFNRPAVATIGADGAPAVRTVVLRSTQPGHRILAFHTDVRSTKVSELRARPQLCWHFWNSGLSLQLRISAAAVLHARNGLAEAAWASLHAGSRATYCQAIAPGTERQTRSLPAPTNEAEGFENFVVVATQVRVIEALELAQPEHVRAQFTHDNGAWSRVWLAP